MSKYDKLIGTQVSFSGASGVVNDIIEGHRKTYAIICQNHINMDEHHKENMLVPIEDIGSVYYDADGNEVFKYVDIFIGGEKS